VTGLTPQPEDPTTVAKSSDVHKEDVTHQLETFSPFGHYQYHVPEHQMASAPRQFIHVFPIKPVSNSPEVFVMDAQPHEDGKSTAAMENHNLALENESDGKLVMMRMMPVTASGTSKPKGLDWIVLSCR